MQKPAETKKLYLIAAILYAARIVLGCLLFPAAVLLFARYRNVDVQFNPNMAVMYFVPLLLMLVYPLLAFWLSRQKEITPQSTKLTAILLPSCRVGLSLLNLGFQLLERRMLQNEQIGSFTMLLGTVQLPLKLTGLAATAGFILLCCACAKEFVLTHPAPDGVKHLSQYAAICAGAGMLLRIVSILFSEQFGLLFSSWRLVLPMKWKLILIGLTLLTEAPFTAAAIWFWLKPDSIRPATKLILAPILYLVPVFLSYGIGQFLIRLVGQEGMETISAFSMANTVSGYFSVLLDAALILTCCAGTIAFFEAKRTPSDGASSNI